MKRLPFILLIILLIGSFFAFKSSVARTPPGKYEQIMGLMGQLLAQGHFSPQNIDDDFSKKVFEKFMGDLDFEKNVFLKSDYDSLAALYANHIDNEMKGAPVESFLAISAVFDRRIRETAGWSKVILAKPFDFKVDESIVLDFDKLAYPVSSNERRDRWRKKLKYLALEKYVDLVDEKKANKGRKGYVVKSDTELEKQARSRTDTVINRLFERYRAKYTDDDKFDMFMNAIANTMDPHTSFMAPIDRRYFDEEMSGVFFGIGAALQQVDGKIKISSINAGSPAEKSGQLQGGDIITKVAQGDGPAEDLMGYNVQDAVKLIRGKEGTVVKLTVRKPDGTVKVVAITRAKIENDFDTYARSAIINDAVKHTKVGIIYLPEFYADFDNPNGRRSYLDVAKEVQKLKDAAVNGIIIDLRYNGGGSLYDVVQMVGLFVGKGPVVQVKDRINQAEVLKVKDESVLYDGPLAVMVNEFSASASEIFAAAIQDYGRGVIIGSTSTFGKGTVQRNFGLDTQNGITVGGESDLGTVKLTLQKFYRVSGGSTQLKGVESDIVLPSYMDLLKLREKDNKDALPYDEIAKAEYNPWKNAWNLNEIKNLSNQRMKADSAFKIIRANSQWLVRENNESALNIDRYREERKAIKAKSDQMNAAQKLKNKMNVTLLPAELHKFSGDKNKEERAKQWLKSLSEDIYLNQAAYVVDDMINIDRLAKNAAAVSQ